MLLSTFHKSLHFIARFCFVQLFITCISLPILVAWGLPLSYASPIGNFIFSPLLMLFLGASSLVFFCQLFHLPISIPLWLLNIITQIWTWCLQCAQKNWLIGFARPPALLLLLIPFCAIGIIIMLNHYPLWKKNLLLSILLFGSCFGLSYFTPHIAPISVLACNKGEVTIIATHNTLSVIDPGVIGQTPSALSWVEYTLAPHITSLTGKTTIDHLILLHVNGTTCQAVEQLCAKMHVKNIYLVTWEGQATKSMLRNFMSMKHKATTSDSRLIRLASRSQSLLSFSDGTHLSLEKIDATIKSVKLTIPCFMINGLIDNHKITLYPSKYAL